MIPLFQGIILGLSLSILFGPMIFIYIETTLEKSWRAALMTAIGVWVSDLFFILLSLFALSFIMKISQSASFEFWIGTTGSLVLIGLGLATFFLPQKNSSDQSKEKKKKPFSTGKYWLKGFLINTLNPFAALIWIGAIGSFSVDQVGSFRTIELFILGVFGTIILTDLLKVYLAEQLIDWLSESNLFYLKKVSGAGILAFGILLFCKIIF